MNPREITDVKELQDLLVESLNGQEELMHQLLNLQGQLQEALDEIKRLKGEQGGPTFKSSRGRKRGEKIKKGKHRNIKSKKVRDSSSSSSGSVDRYEQLDTPPSDLPPDAQFKGYRIIYQKDIRIEAERVGYKIARWYSASEAKYYESPLPQTYQGRIGSRLRSLVQILHHCGDMTHSRIRELLSHLGVSLSKGGISNILTQSDWVEQEQAELLESSLSCSPYLQMDSTSSREKGQGMYTQILCGEYFSLFYTQPGKSRLDVYAALQGKRRQEVALLYNTISKERLLAAKASKMHIEYLEKTCSSAEELSMEELENIFDKEAIFERTNQNRRSIIAGALAAGYYYQQNQLPTVKYLMSDEAAEYKAVAQKKQIHCWVHAIRHYRLLNPTNQYLRQIHNNFMDRLWLFYQRIKTYRELSSKKQSQQKKNILSEFDQLFSPSTDYKLLNQMIERTQKNREYLLAVVDYPFFPLHNNVAERGARRIVRKRDISFHTWSQRGTKMRDAFLSLQQTAKKLKVNFLEYIIDRNAKAYQIESLAIQLRKAYQR